MYLVISTVLSILKGNITDRQTHTVRMVMSRRGAR